LIVIGEKLKNKYLFSVLCSFSVVTVGQTVPEAGSLQQQLDKERRIELPKLQPQAPTVIPAPLKAQGELVVEAREFRFAGNTLVDKKILSQVLATYLERPLDLQELQTAASLVAQTYRNQGWIARAYLPEQDIEQGVITIQIVEAIFGGIEIDEANKPILVGTAQIQALFDAQLQPGEKLSQHRLERALLLSDDLPGISANGALAEGNANGQTVMKIKMTNSPFISGDVTADNTGSRATGNHRALASLQVNSPARLGDQINLLALVSEGSRYGRAAYTVPLGNDGWRVGVNASAMNYKVITHDVPNDLRGTSNVVGLEGSYPLLRSRMGNFYLNLSADRKGFDNERDGATSTQYHTSVYTLGLNGNNFDSLLGGGANSGSVTLSRGDLANQVNNETLQGEFRKLRYQLRRQQVLNSNLSANAVFSGQWANRNLDSSEKFYLGGASGVRAYPTSEGGASLGQMINLDLRQQLPNGFNASVFYDWGRLKDPAGGSLAQAISLKGWGLALGWQSESGLSLKGTWSRRIGENPNPTSSGSGIGNDQDGSLIRNRFWLTASLPF
jgi:hemolysin activation/secretion protein